MELQANKKRRDCSFQPGDLVLLRLQPYRQQTVRHCVSQRLSKRHFGPFLVLHHIGSLAYELELPPSSRIHPVIHISQLRPFYGSDPFAQFVPIPLKLEACVNLYEENTTLSPPINDFLSSHASTSQDLPLDSAAETLTSNSHQTSPFNYHDLPLNKNQPLDDSVSPPNATPATYPPSNTLPFPNMGPTLSHHTLPQVSTPQTASSPSDSTTTPSLNQDLLIQTLRTRFHLGWIVLLAG